MGPPWVLGIWGEWLFIFRDLRSTGNCLRGAGEQAHSFGDLGSPAKKQKKIEEKPPFCLIFKKFLCFWGDSPQTPLLSSKSNNFSIACTSMLDGEKIWQLNSFVVDLVTLKLLIFRMVITYLGMPRLHQITLIVSKFFRGEHAPGPP